MKYLKVLAKSFAYIISVLVISMLIITIFSYFNILDDNTVKVLKLLSVLTSVFIGGYLIGKNGNKKGYIEGARLGIIITFILILLSLILKSFTVQSLLYYVIVIISTIFGSMIGVLKKVKK